MILGIATINATDYYISMQGISLDKWYAPHLVDYEFPNYSIATRHGGHCKTDYGSISFSPQLFSNEWPPPNEIDLILKYTPTTTPNIATAKTLFEGKCNLTRLSNDNIEYDMFYKDENDLLEESANGYGDGVTAEDVLLPRAIGHVAHVTPVRLEDFPATTKGTYHKGYLLGTTPGTDYKVYDDGVEITPVMVQDNLDGTFSLLTDLRGDITMSGTAAAGETLSDVFNYFCGASFLNLTYNNTNSRVISPTVSMWITNQQTILEFLSELSAYFTHLFYTNSTTLFLRDMLLDNGTETITEFQFFNSNISYNSPIKKIKTTIQFPHSVDMVTSDAGTTGKYVKEDEEEIEINGSYKYGEEEEISSALQYDDSGFADAYAANLRLLRYNNKLALTDIKTILEKPQINVEMPIEDNNLPDFGKKISFINTAYNQDTNVSLRIREISFDFLNENLTISGDGEIS